MFQLWLSTTACSVSTNEITGRLVLKVISMSSALHTCSGIPEHLGEWTFDERGGTVAGYVGHSGTSSVEPAL